MKASQSKKSTETEASASSDDYSQALTRAQLEEKVGQFLKSRREERKLDIETVCNDLKIRRFFIESIEKGDLDQLPGSVYTTGFIKSYTEYLGLDSNEILSALSQETVEIQDPSTSKSSESSNDNSAMPQWVWFLFAGGLVVLAATLIYNVSVSSPKKSMTLALPADVAKTNTNYTQKNEPQVIAQDDIYVLATKPTWVKITDDNGALVNAKFLKVGDTLNLSSYNSKKFTAGDGSAIRFKKGDKEFPIYFADQGTGQPTLVENYLLDFAKFEALLQPKSEQGHQDAQGSTPAGNSSSGQHAPDSQNTTKESRPS